MHGTTTVEYGLEKENKEVYKKNTDGQEDREVIVDVHPGRIRSDDFGWADRMPTPLWRRCLDVIAGDFALYHPPHQLMDVITPMNAAYLAETLDTGLPVAWVVHVPWDEYWRRRYADRPSGQLSPSDDFRSYDFRHLPTGVRSDVGEYCGPKPKYHTSRGPGF